MENTRFLKACRCEPVDCTPVWFMRQAGRYMEEYRKIRSKYSFLTMCKTPELAAEVTLQPVKKLGVDAAILFADILLPLEGMGVSFDFAKNEGPVIYKPVRSKTDIIALKIIEPDKDVPFVLEAIKLIKRELNGQIPLIGFAGAPFTLASYIIEGGHSKNYLYTKCLMYKEPQIWHLLMEKLAQVVLLYLNAQIEAGVEAIQIFDSWVGCLSPSDYKEYVLPHMQRLIGNLKDNVPVIHFATNNANLLELMREAGGDVIGIDWRIDLDKAWQRLGFKTAIQGNLDPAVLFAPMEVVREKAREILDKASGRAGHIFNLGHGILPQTPVENVIALVEEVHNYSQNR
jgi:uroporphyrinogen decarboxylase